jgi:hypothetical protein
MCRRKEEGGLGFHDLNLFNLAMLARQDWGLIMAPDSLCSQVLKAKYFWNSDLRMLRRLRGFHIRGEAYSGELKL